MSTLLEVFFNTDDSRVTCDSAAAFCAARVVVCSNKAAISAPCATTPATLEYFGSRFLSTARSGVATKIEEYVPVSMPTSSAMANSWRLVAPMMNDPTTNNEITGKAEDNVVLSERAKTWFDDTLTMLPIDILEVAKRSMFSRTLSKTTTVS